MCVCLCDVLFERATETLTEEDDDTEEDGYDGACAQAGGHEVLLVGAVAVHVTLAHFDPQVGGVGHGQVARVCDDDGDLVDATFKDADLQAHLSVVTWEREREERTREWAIDLWWLLFRDDQYEEVSLEINQVNVQHHVSVAGKFFRGY